MPGVNRMIAGLCAALLPPEHGGEASDALAVRVRAYLERLPVELRAGFLGAVAALDLATRATSRSRLASLDPHGRADVLERLAATRPELEHAVLALKSLVLLVAGSEAYHGDLKQRSETTDLARPDAELDVTPADEWPYRTRADVVVVGSGAGGAFAARELARAGLDVVIVEEGRRFSVDEFRSGHPLQRFADLYRDAGSSMALGRPPVLLPLGRGVGGTTLVNSGTCYRPPDRVLQRWRALGCALADGDAIAPRLDEVEATLQVGPVPSSVLGRNGHLALAGADALGWTGDPLVRNAPGCGGCCQCAIGCPRNAKFGVHLNALPQACAAGARIVSEARVERIAHRAGRAGGVVARRADGSRFVIAAARVVVAAGTTETPPLLWRSQLRHPQLGRNLAVHPAIGVSGRFDEPVVAWHGVLQSAGVEEFHDSDGILIEATSTPPGMGSMTLPGYGPGLMRELSQAHHLASVGALVADAPSGRVHRVGNRTVVRYDLARSDAARLVKALGVMTRLLLAAGAREVLTGVTGAPPVRTEREAADALVGTDPRRLHLAAFHPTGTCAAGEDPQRFPARPDGALRGVTGVWVADASLLPTSPAVNPQVTIMAFALGVAEAVNAT